MPFFDGVARPLSVVGLALASLAPASALAQNAGETEAAQPPAASAPAATAPAATAPGAAAPAAVTPASAAPQVSPSMKPTTPAGKVIPAPPQGMLERKPVGQTVGPDGSPALPLDSETMATMGGWDLGVYGFIRSRVAIIENDTEGALFLGQNDGFVLGSARFGMEATRDVWRIRIGMDGAADRGDSANAAEARTTTTLRDAFLAWEPNKYFNALIGQFKPAYDREELQSTRDLLFISRAVESRGVPPLEGRPVSGLSLSRQAGLMLYTQPNQYESGIFWQARYSLVNGDGSNRAANDNEQYAHVARFETGWRKSEDMKVELGGGLMFNERTVGDPRNQLTEERSGFAVDLQAEAFMVILNAQYMTQTTAQKGVDGEPDRTASGWHAGVGLRLPYGFVPAYRIASFDPTSDFDVESQDLSEALDQDEVTEHTVALNWILPDHPIKLQLQYTSAIEDESRALANNRFEALIQAQF